MGSIIHISPNETHIFAFPFPAKGHINPLLHLCNRLAAKGLRITLITTSTTFKSVKKEATNNIDIECIEDGLENHGNGQERGQVEEYFRKFRAAASQGLRDLLQKYKDGGYGFPKVVIYDSTMPWVLDVVHSMGVKGASFFTQSCAVNSVYYHIHNGTITVPYRKETVTLPSMPDLGFDDFPRFDNAVDLTYIITRLLANQFSNIDDVDYILFNTFQKLEDELATWMENRWPIRTVGPTAPSTLFNKRPKDKHENYLFETNTETCLKWLDERENNSVVYVSFGSIAAPNKDQIEEVAEALLRVKCKFLWIVRTGEESKLPTLFKNEIASEQGLIINWGPQLDILAHPAVACFVTHCGWNSTLEALSSGVPMIAVPQWVDQNTNAKFIADVWKVGIRVKVNEKGIVTKEELERCLLEVTVEKKGKEVKENAAKWKELAIKAVSEGGTSDTNIEQFVTTISSLV